MSGTTEYTAALRVEARRCERLASGLTDPATVAQLLAWADEYDRSADDLQRVLAQLTSPAPRAAA